MLILPEAMTPLLTSETIPSLDEKIVIKKIVQKAVFFLAFLPKVMKT